jgi:CubicO group peptidase (beta-lactamase class C family)
VKQVTGIPLTTVLTLSLLRSIAANSLYAQGGAGQSIEGFWMGMQDDGAWAFVFELTDDARGAYSGVIHVYQKNNKIQEVPIDEIAYDGAEIRLHMKMNDVRYRGEVDFEARAIDGEFQYTDGSTLAMTLNLVDPATVPGLSAREGVAGEPYDYEYRVPDSLGDGWEASHLRDQGLDPEIIDELVTAIVAGDYGFLHSLLIVRNGSLVLDEYFYNHDRETLHRLASATKSVTSLLTGIAIDQGLLNGPEENILTFFPDYASEAAPGWDKVKIGHILTMSAGVGWDKKDLGGFYGSDEHFATVFRQPVVEVPGERFEYVSPNMDLLAGVIKHVSGLYADEFAEKYLFGPLGIIEYEWDYGRWEGHPLMDGSLALKPRDMAKIGRLVLDDGKWAGTQIVSSGWIMESTALHMDVEGPEDYGYLWWRTSAPFEGKMIEGVFASGWGSQFIFVVPEYNLVVVATGGNEDNSMHFAPLKMFPDYILPAMK